MTDLWLSGIGTVGAVLILVDYALVSAGRFRVEQLRYQAINLTAAVLLAYYYVLLQAWAGLALNVAWGLIGLTYVVKAIRTGRGYSGLRKD